jgi:hypothetical protein
MIGFTINKYVVIAVNILFIAMLLGMYSLYNSNVKLKHENGLLTQNNKAYQDELTGMRDSQIIERYVYKMTLADLENTREFNDSIMDVLDNTRRQLGIANNKIKEYQHIIANMKTDTIVNITQIITEDCQFDLNIDYNPQTKFRIKNEKIDSEYLLTHSADIQASFEGIGYIRESWKEPKFFKRLFTFNWKKIKDEKYILKSDNDMIKIHNFKVIKLIE